MRLFGCAARHDPAAIDHKPHNAYGFDLDASVRVPARHPQRLERLCRYIARPPLAHERLTRLDDGRYCVALKRPCRDGTTHIVLDGPELIAKLVALVPPPRRHLTPFFGVYAPNAKRRSRVIPPPPCSSHSEVHDVDSSRPDLDAPLRRQRLSWAALLKRVFAIDVEQCPRCSSKMQHLAALTSPTAITAILASVRRATAPP